MHCVSVNCVSVHCVSVHCVSVHCVSVHYVHTQDYTHSAQCKGHCDFNNKCTVQVFMQCPCRWRRASVYRTAVGRQGSTTVPGLVPGGRVYLLYLSLLLGGEKG